MKKILIIILIVFIANGFGYCQYPQPRTYPSDHIVINRKPFIGSPIPIDSFKSFKSPFFYISNDSTYFVYLKSDSIVAVHYVDSSKIYWQQFNKYQRLMNEELEKLNRLQNPQMTRKVFRYQDSCKRYEELLKRLKK